MCGGKTPANLYSPKESSKGGLCNVSSVRRIYDLPSSGRVCTFGGLLLDATSRVPAGFHHLWLNF